MRDKAKVVVVIFVVVLWVVWSGVQTGRIRDHLRGPRLVCPVCGESFWYADRGDPDVEMGWITKVYGDLVPDPLWFNEKERGIGYLWDSRRVCKRAECLEATWRHNVDVIKAYVLEGEVADPIQTEKEPVTLHVRGVVVETYPQ